MTRGVLDLLTPRPPPTGRVRADTEEDIATSVPRAFLAIPKRSLQPENRSRSTKSLTGVSSMAWHPGKRHAPTLSSDVVDAKIRSLFPRYDTDNSGFLDSVDEIRMLTYNLCYTLELVKHLDAPACGLSLVPCSIHPTSSS